MILLPQRWKYQDYRKEPSHRKCRFPNECSDGCKNNSSSVLLKSELEFTEIALWGRELCAYCITTQRVTIGLFLPHLTNEGTQVNLTVPGSIAAKERVLATRLFDFTLITTLKLSENLMTTGTNPQNIVKCAFWCLELSPHFHKKCKQSKGKSPTISHLQSPVLEWPVRRHIY